MIPEERAQRVSTLMGTCIMPALLEEAELATAAGLDTLLRTKTYALLSDAATGMWHLSVPTLAEILRQELETGEVETPEEQS